MNGREWKQTDTDTLIRMNAVGYTDSEMAAVTGHTRDGLPPPHRHGAG